MSCGQATKKAAPDAQNETDDGAATGPDDESAHDSDNATTPIAPAPVDTAWYGWDEVHHIIHWSKMA